MSGPIQSIEQFAAWLRSCLPATRVQVQPFPSGVIWLDVFTRDRQWQLASYPQGAASWPQGGFAVAEITGENSWTTDYSYTSQDMLSSAAQLLRLLQDAGLALPPAGAAA